MLIFKTEKKVDDYLNKEDVKEYLSVGDRVVNNLFKRPDFPCVEIGKGKKVVKYSDLIAFLNSVGRKERRRVIY